MSINASGLSLKVARFFECNPGEELSSLDVAAKFDVPPHNISLRLQRLVELGYLHKDAGSRGGGSKCDVYRAGPALLKSIGVAA